MATIKNLGVKNSGQTCIPKLLYASLVGAFLIGSTTAFAITDSERMTGMENKIQSLQNDVSQMASGMASRSAENDGLQMHGFMDVGFATNTDNNLAAHPKGFNVGALSFYLTSQFGDKVKALVEPNFEVTRDGAISVDLERLQLGYTFSDNATLWGGRFHTPYGYWNTGFHHGAQMQTSVVRPRFLDFEDKGGILPAHMVGLWSAGKAKAGAGKLTYDFFAGNGPKIAMGADPVTGLGIQDINLAGDNNHQAMVGLNVGYEFSGSLDGLRLAVHSIRGDVDDNNSTASLGTLLNKTELNMVGGSAVYLSNDWEIMGEYYGFNNKDKSGTTGTHKSWADYLQVGKSFNALTPFVRFEKTLLSQQDNYFSMQDSGQSYTRQALGFKYDVNNKASLKLELLNSNFEADVGRTASKYRSLYTQYAVRF